MQPYLSVIIPSYNEMRNIKRGVLDDVLSYLQNQSLSWELILSDDGSTDGTLAYFQSFLDKLPKEVKKNVSILENVHAGKGPTVQAGMLAANGKWRLFADFDQSTPVKEVVDLLAYAPKFQVIIGSREIAGAKRNKEPLHRHLMGKGFNVFTQLLAVPGILDTQCGFKLFSEEATMAVFPKLYVYGRHTLREDAFTGAFDVEALYLARKFGYKIKEVPIFWQHNLTDRVDPIKDSSRMLRDIIRIRLADMQGKYPKLVNSR